VAAEGKQHALAGRDRAEKAGEIGSDVEEALPAGLARDERAVKAEAFDRR
jgi:hypothetical protein